MCNCRYHTSAPKLKVQYTGGGSTSFEYECCKSTSEVTTVINDQKGDSVLGGCQNQFHEAAIIYNVTNKAKEKKILDRIIAH
jgi:hypothetical protein